MEDGSILLEHTLVLAGESVDSNTVWQGWPSDVQMTLKDYYSHLQFKVDEAIAMNANYSLVTTLGRRTITPSNSRSELDDCSVSSRHGSESQPLLHVTSLDSASAYNITASRLNA